MCIDPSTNEPFEVYPEPERLKFSVWASVGLVVFLLVFFVWLISLAIKNVMGPTGWDHTRVAAVPVAIAVFVAACIVVTIWATIDARDRLRRPKPILIISEVGLWYEYWTKEPIPWSVIDSIGRGLGDFLIVKFSRHHRSTTRLRWGALLHRSPVVMIIQILFYYFGRRLDLYVFRGEVTHSIEDIIKAIRRHVPVRDRP